MIISFFFARVFVCCCCCCCCSCGGSVGCPLPCKKISHHTKILSCEKFIFFDFPFIRFISLCARRRRRLSPSLLSLFSSLLFSCLPVRGCVAHFLFFFFFFFSSVKEKERERKGFVSSRFVSRVVTVVVVVVVV